MSIACIISAYDNDISPPLSVINFIGSIALVKEKRKEIKNTKDFLHLINIISPTNKINWISKLEEKIKLDWKDEYIDIFTRIVLRQTLYTKIFVEIFFLFGESEQKKIFDELFSKQEMTHSESLTLGTFIGSIYIKKFPGCDIIDIIKVKCLENLELKPGFVIALFLELCKTNDKQIINLAKHNYNVLSKRNLDTKLLMLLFDLDSSISMYDTDGR